MFGTIPQAKVLTMLWLATVLAVIAVALLALAVGRNSSRQHTQSATPPVQTAVVWPRVTPGSTAHARYNYRLSLGSR